MTTDNQQRQEMTDFLKEIGTIILENQPHATFDRYTRCLVFLQATIAERDTLLREHGEMRNWIVTCGGLDNITGTILERIPNRQIPSRS